MYVYSLTLQPPTAINQVICGEFTKPGNQDICIAKGHMLDLIRYNKFSGKLITVCSQDVFENIKRIIPLRINGITKDFIIVGSDSGCISILEYDEKKNLFIRLHRGVYEKGKINKSNIGNYLAVDSRGSIILVGAVKRDKYIFTIGFNKEKKLAITKPIILNKNHTIVFDMIALNCGYHYSIFTCI